MKPGPLQQPTAVGPGGPRATRGAQPEPPAAGRGLSRRLLSFSGRHMRPAGPWGPYISMSCQPANSAMARPSRPDSHPPAAGNPGGGAGGCASHVDISSTSLTNAGRARGCHKARGDAMGIRIPRPPPPRGTTRNSGVATMPLPRRRTPPPPPPPPGDAKHSMPTALVPMVCPAAAHRCGCVYGLGRQADLHMAPIAMPQAGRQGHAARRTVRVLLIIIRAY